MIPQHLKIRSVISTASDREFEYFVLRCVRLEQDPRILAITWDWSRTFSAIMSLYTTPLTRRGERRQRFRDRMIWMRRFLSRFRFFKRFVRDDRRHTSADYAKIIARANCIASAAHDEFCQVAGIPVTCRNTEFIARIYKVLPRDLPRTEEYYLGVPAQAA